MLVWRPRSRESWQGEVERRRKRCHAQPGKPSPDHIACPMPAKRDAAHAGAECCYRRHGKCDDGWEEAIIREEKRTGHQDRGGNGGMSAWIGGLGLVPLQRHHWARAAIHQLHGMMRHDAAEERGRHRQDEMKGPSRPPRMADET